MFRKVLEAVNRACQKTIILLVRCYQLFLSPFLGPRCRFYPSCSHYCIEAVQHHGLIRGVFYSVKRLMRCHPLTSGGYDPVPNSKK